MANNCVQKENLDTFMFILILQYLIHHWNFIDTFGYKKYHRKIRPRKFNV